MTISVRRLLFSFKIHNYSGGTLLTQRIYSPQSRKERKENFIFSWSKLMSS